MSPSSGDTRPEAHVCDGRCNINCTKGAPSPVPSAGDGGEDGPLYPFGRQDPALVEAMKAAIDSQIMEVRGSRQNGYAATACAAVASISLAAAVGRAETAEAEREQAVKGAAGRYALMEKYRAERDAVLAALQRVRDLADETVERFGSECGSHEHDPKHYPPITVPFCDGCQMARASDATLRDFVVALRAALAVPSPEGETRWTDEAWMQQAVHNGVFAADIVAIEPYNTAADRTRAVVRRTLEALLANGIIQAVPMEDWPYYFVPAPPYESPLPARSSSPKEG